MRETNQPAIFELILQTSEGPPFRSISAQVQELCRTRPADTLDFRLLAYGKQLKLYLVSSAPPDRLRATLNRLMPASWREVSPELQGRVLDPFPLRHAALLGLRNGDPVQVTSPAGELDRPLTLWNVHPLRSHASDVRLIPFLSRAPFTDWELSIRLTPTGAEPYEKRILLHQLVHIASLHARVPDTRLERSVTGAAERLQRLGATAAEVTLTLSSARPLPRHLVQAAQLLLTGQPGGLELSWLDEEEREEVREARSSLRPARPIYGKAPTGLERLPFLYPEQEITRLLAFIGPLSLPPQKAAEVFASGFGGTVPTATVLAASHHSRSEIHVENCDSQ